jgi:hypothetical protein
MTAGSVDRRTEGFHSGGSPDEAVTGLEISSSSDDPSSTGSRLPVLARRNDFFKLPVEVRRPATEEEDPATAALEEACVSR